MVHSFIIAAVTADGFIARDPSQPSTDWTSKEDKKHFMELTKRAGVVVMGSKTYETFRRPLKDRKNIIYSRTKKFEGTESTSESPQELFTRLEKEGFKEVAICGGGSIYTLFLENKCVDKIYLTIENKIFGQGVKLFDKSLDVNLELVGNTKLGENTVLLEYNVIK
nr:Dihydrofolate reductase [uncultured bacterium]